MDGVVYRGNRPIPGARRFVEALQNAGRPYLFLTNNPDYTPADLSRRLKRMGMNVPPEHFYTAAEATALFLAGQSRRPRVFAIGEKALLDALRNRGAVITDRKPDYVVVGSSKRYGFHDVEKAINFVAAGARLIGTNPDPLGPAEDGVTPGCGALVAPIERATGRKTYFIGKPNPLMMRTALRTINVRSSNAYMVGDRMDTDIIAGIESGMKTILVLSGVTSRPEIGRFPYRPDFVFRHVGEIPLHRLP